ncbi:2OG-Fe(II) oxygenase superfamily protein [Tetraselmis virus 1]|uniref:2OG-Fe(II) oxygenase superfamily protein n=1 Tax=Tetraselmis virus 1 TaxID=2060617 RepID=A0A2P0VP91_9VIRU|nr:2OG-Fe(II) oxygenase superfamily protein [Tetraselmis virus 1]AUF82724.1 2OG-Fe(II) oxygenase superfamily protein [Tetraselmis virus 1]
MKKNGVWHSVVCYDEEGYRIPPHVDRPEKAITTLLYLASDEEYDNDRGTGYYKNEKWESRIGQAVYQPNAYFAFVPDLDTWHGVSEVAKGKSRILANATLYLSGQESKIGSWYSGNPESRIHRKIKMS